MRSFGRLQPSSNLDLAAWIRPRLRPFGSGVASIVPDGFPTYVRILHPESNPDGEFVLWRDIAEKQGRIMHRLAAWSDISPPPPPDSPNFHEPWHWRLDTGNLPTHLLTALCSVLARHTTAAATCCFCLWNGYGWLQDDQQQTGWTFYPLGSDPPPRVAARSPEPLLTSLVRLPARDYLFFEGPLEAATDAGWSLTEDCFIPQSPNLFWPKDRAWCVASEIDLLSTLVGGSELLAEALLSDARLEAWRVFPDDFVS